MMPKVSRILKIGAVWAMQVIAGAIFVIAALPKLSSQSGIVANFERWGMPNGFYLLVGIWELVFGVLLFIPRLARYAAFGLIVLMLGALVTHVVHAEFLRLLVPAVLISILLAIAFLRRSEHV